MQIRLTVLGPRSGRAVRGCDVLITAPGGTPLSAVAGALASAAGSAQSGGRSAGSSVVLYAGSQRLAPTAVLGVPPLVDGALVSLHTPAEQYGEGGGHADQGQYGRFGQYGRPPAELPRLHVVGGPDAGGVHLLPGGQARIGRSADADVPLDDPDVSRLHCEIAVGADGAVTVADLGSTNGTTLSGKAVGAQPVPFPPGALLGIGESTLRLAAAHTPEPAPLPSAPDEDGHLRVSLRRAAWPPSEYGGLGNEPGPETGAAYRDPADAPDPREAVTFGRGIPSPAADDPDGRRRATGERARGAHAPGGEADRPRVVDAIGAWAKRRLGGGGRGAGAGPETVDDTEAETLRGRWPDPAAVLLTALGPGRRLWERGPGHPDALNIRLGSADLVSEDGARRLPGVPFTVDLRSPLTAALALSGPRPRLAGLARAVLAQLCALHSPAALEIVLISADRARGSDQRAEEWSWVNWLPHLRPAHGQDCRLLLAFDRDQAESRTAELTRRLESGALGPRWATASAASVAAATAAYEGPYTVLVIDGDPGSVTLRETAARLAASGPASGIHVLSLTETGEHPVITTGLVAHLSGDVATTLHITPAAGSAAPAAAGPAGDPEHPRDADRAPDGDAGDAGEARAWPAGGSSDSRGRTRTGGDAGNAAGGPAGGGGRGADDRGRTRTGGPDARPAERDDGRGGTQAVGRDGDRDHGRSEGYGGTGGGPAASGAAVLASDGRGAGGAGRAGEPGRQQDLGRGPAGPGERSASAGRPQDAELGHPGARHTRAAGPLPVSPPEGIVVDAVSAAWAEHFARALAPLREADEQEMGGRSRHALPVTVRLLDELDLALATPAKIAARWAEAPAGAAAARAVLGAGGGGRVVVDLVAEGPHTVVGGAPGSGKTELLRSLAAGLAAAERPDRLALVLVDGAGQERGEGLLAVADLPHVSTHLVASDPVRMREFAQALSAELKRRAEVLGEQTFGAWHADRLVAATLPHQSGTADRKPTAPDAARWPDAAPQEPARSQPPGPVPVLPRLPRLVVIVDDFDALVAPALGSPGRPTAGSVVRALETVARDGERLGVHLVFATGRPERTAGTDADEAARLRIALRMPDPESATLLVHVEDPAGLDDAVPGRGYLRRPGGAVTAFQAARVSARIPRTATLRPTVVALEWERMGDPPARRQVRELGNGPTDLALLASALERAAESSASGAAAVSSPASADSATPASRAPSSAPPAPPASSGAESAGPAEEGPLSAISRATPLI
ncbi:FtsK/SpoIIIE domain-containing protein [Streptomyces polygonati]|uniref:FtsK/SpoIIIE domain-containing protein n=1 Tax=Streptomyces polygonati TaxID=1617087 RepID=A0ABV8HWM3_9ACTN